MNILKLVNTGIWMVFAIAAAMMTLIHFEWFYVFMGFLCMVVSVVSWLEYRWSNKEDHDWQGE